MSARQVLVATDKFRGTATAAEVGDAVVASVRVLGWRVRSLPLSDGGEGFLDGVDGDEHHSQVTSSAGGRVLARWYLLPAAEGRPATAVLEVAQAAGLLAAGGAERNDPLAATTRGVGEQLLAACAAGARRLVLGCGGSATTDGGRGMVEAVREGGGLAAGTELVAATDVRTRFLDAAAVFGPQKGADAAAVRLLRHRLVETAISYQRETGVDVTSKDGSGAAGGLAGGVLALGGSIQPGFEVVAALRGLDRALTQADAVVTGEGRLDATSLQGKVVGEVLNRVASTRRALVVVGDADPDAVAAVIERWPGVDVVSLTSRYGREQAVARTTELVADEVRRWLA